MRESVSSTHRRESDPLPYVGEACSFSVQRRECLLHTEERVYDLHMSQRQAPSLYRGEGVFVTQPREFHILDVEEADSSSIQGREIERE